MTLMTFDKQSNGRRTAVVSKLNRSCITLHKSNAVGRHCAVQWIR